MWTSIKARIVGEAPVKHSISPNTLQLWSKVNRSQSVPWPLGRGFHAADIVPGPGLLVIGGEGDCDQTLVDSWVMDLANGTWEKVNI